MSSFQGSGPHQNSDTRIYQQAKSMEESVQKGV